MQPLGVGPNIPMCVVLEGQAASGLQCKACLVRKKKNFKYHIKYVTIYLTY